MRKLMNFILLSCKKATFLIEKREIAMLSAKEKVQLKLHTSMCDACRSYEKQSKTVNKALSKWFGNSYKKKEVLSKEAKDRIIQELNRS